jgi:hypothetical protein
MKNSSVKPPKPLPAIPKTSHDVLYNSEDSSSASASYEKSDDEEVRITAIPLISKPTIPIKVRHHNYVVLAPNTFDSSKFRWAIRAEYRMHVSAASFVSILAEDDVVLLLCTPDVVEERCKLMDLLIRSQKGKAIAVCIIPKMRRHIVVETKDRMMKCMAEDHIVFASYRSSKNPELTDLKTFWWNVDDIVKRYDKIS